MWKAFLCVVAAAAACAAVGCRDSRAQSGRDVIVWQKLGSWSGHGLLQTNPFENETGMLRVDWDARGSVTPGDRKLRVVLHSAVSGRSLSVPVDHQGPGSGTAFINEDPRGFFLVIESTGLDWTVAVAEGISARQTAAN
jgi:hypothetical protein